MASHTITLVKRQLPHTCSTTTTQGDVYERDTRTVLLYSHLHQWSSHSSIWVTLSALLSLSVLVVVCSSPPHSLSRHACANRRPPSSHHRCSRRQHRPLPAHRSRRPDDTQTRQPIASPEHATLITSHLTHLRLIRPPPPTHYPSSLPTHVPRRRPR